MDEAVGVATQVEHATSETLETKIPFYFVPLRWNIYLIREAQSSLDNV